MVKIEKKTHEEMRASKRALIIKQARKVFEHKGFATVTMQDIIDASKISRGGIYLYFDSVESIFKEVINEREQSTRDWIEKLILENKSFDQLVDAYLLQQKNRLMTMDGSLLRAVYEYHFTHKEPSDIAFRKEQVKIIRDNLSMILTVGVKEGHISPEFVLELSEQIMFVIEGLSVYALLGGLKEETIDRQFGILKQQLVRSIV